MTSRGFLIRFIDIGLILLFGFVMISDIESLSQVELSPESSAQEAEQDETDRTFVTVVIDPDDVFAIADPASGTVIAAGIARTDVLSELLRRLQEDTEQAQRHLIVLISPDPNSTVQRTVDVMDVCDRLNLAKSLQADLGRRNGEDGA